MNAVPRKRLGPRVLLLSGLLEILKGRLLPSARRGSRSAGAIPAGTSWSLRGPPGSKPGGGPGLATANAMLVQRMNIKL
jgi:hypothetical protein